MARPQPCPRGGSDERHEAFRRSRCPVRDLDRRVPRCRGTASGAGGESARTSHHRALPRLGARQRRADLARRRAHRLHAPARQQARRQVGVGAVDPERRRIAAPLPGQGIGRRAGRRTASACCISPKASRRERRSSCAGSTSTVRRRRSPTSSRRRATRRWSPDGKSIAFSMFVAEQEKWTISMPAEPKGAKWTPAPRVVEHAALPAGSGRLPRRRLHAPVRRAGRRRHAARADDRASGASAPASCAAARRSTGRPTASRSSSTATESPDADLQVRDVAACTSSTSRRARFASSSRSRRLGPPGRCRRTASTVAFTGYAPTGRSHTVSDLYVIPLDRRRQRHAEDQRRLRSRSDQPALGAGRQRRLLRRRRSWRAQRPVRVDRRRRQADHHRPAHADVRFGVEGSRRRRHRRRSRASAGRRAVQPEAAGRRSRS